MFDFHLGDGLTVSSAALSSPLVVLGRAGQGKSVFLLQVALELIKNKQHGILYDPFGDLAKDIQTHLQSTEAKQQATFVTQDQFLTSITEINSFVVISGNLFEDGAASTRVAAYKVLKKAYTLLSPTDWIIIDEAFDMVDDELFQSYLAKNGVPKAVLCDQSIMTKLSKKQRDALFENTKQWVIYKPQNVDGRMIEEYLKNPTAKQIAAMEQYHFYWINNGKPTYTRGVWPIQTR